MKNKLIFKYVTEVDEKEFLDKVGQELILTSCSERLERALMCLGGDLKEFLSTLDGVHDVLQHQQGAVKTDQEAVFVCTSCEDHLQLDFTTERPAVAYLLVGSLRAIAKILYSTDADITITQNNQDSRHFR